MSKTKDNLSADLERIWSEIYRDNRITQPETHKQLFMMKMSSYIVRRDASVYNHGVSVGKAKHEKEKRAADQ